MKEDLRLIFGGYRNTAYDGYFQCKNLLKEGIKFEAQISPQNRGSRVNLDLLARALKSVSLKNKIHIVDVDKKGLYSNWEKMLLFTEDIYALSIWKGHEKLFSGKQNLNMFSSLEFDYDVDSSIEEELISFEIKLEKEGSLRQEAEALFFGRERRELANNFKASIVNNMKFYLRELDVFKTMENKRREIESLESLYKKKMGYWNLHESQNYGALEKQVVATDFGIKDLAQLSIFCTLFEKGSHVINEKEVSKDILSKKLEDQKETLLFFSK